MDKEIIKKEKPEILGSAFMPQNFKGKLELAEVLYQSGLCPKDMDSKERVFVALQYGHELGLSPMIAVQNIAVINKRPSLSTIIMKGISFNSGKIEYFETSEILGKDNEILGYKTKGKRKDYPDEFNSSFTFEEARKAGLYDKNMSVWLKYEHDMCRNRSESRFFKAAFAELFAGLLTKQEADELDPVDITPPKEDQILSNIKENMDLGKVSEIEINEFKKENEKIINVTGLELNEDSSKKKSKVKDIADNVKYNGKIHTVDELFPDEKAESKKSDWTFNSINAYSIIFDNDRAKKLRKSMTKEDQRHFWNLARSKAEDYKEKDYKEDIKIILKYEEKMKKKEGEKSE